jgi:hypothetical protein
MQDAEYETARATATSDRACAAVGAACPRGPLNRHRSPFRWLALTVSPLPRAGSEELAAPSATSNRVCRVCRAGTTDHDSDGSTACRTCAAGAYTPPGAQGSCANYPCRPGTSDHDADPATPCEACAPEFFQPAPGRTACLVRVPAVVEECAIVHANPSARVLSRRRCAQRDSSPWPGR